jgi:hypothetical protein
MFPIGSAVAVAENTGRTWVAWRGPLLEARLRQPGANTRR